MFIKLLSGAAFSLMLSLFYFGQPYFLFYMFKVFLFIGIFMLLHVCPRLYSIHINLSSIIECMI